MLRIYASVSANLKDWVLEANNFYKSYCKLIKQRRNYDRRNVD